MSVYQRVIHLYMNHVQPFSIPSGELSPLKQQPVAAIHPEYSCLSTLGNLENKMCSPYLFGIFIWLVVWNMNFIFLYIGNNHPNRRTPSFFQRGRLKPPTRLLLTIILAISCPYSRAEHIPCQNSWEISGNCEDPFQVKFVFHTVCQVLLFFWHVRCRLHMFFPKEDPYFQQFLEMS